MSALTYHCRKSISSNAGLTISGVKFGSSTNMEKDLKGACKATKKPSRLKVRKKVLKNNCMQKKSDNQYNNELVNG